MSKFILELTEQEVQTIGAALGEMPYRVSEPVLRSIQEQINSQVKPPEFEEVPEGAQVN